MRVNAVLFGPTETPQQREILQRDPTVLEKRLVHWPMGRFGTLDEAAGTIAFLASDDASFITGAAISGDVTDPSAAWTSAAGCYRAESRATMTPRARRAGL